MMEGMNAEDEERGVGESPLAGVRLKIQEFEECWPSKHI